MLGTAALCWPESTGIRAGNWRNRHMITGRATVKSKTLENFDFAAALTPLFELLSKARFMPFRWNSLVFFPDLSSVWNLWLLPPESQKTASRRAAPLLSSYDRVWRKEQRPHRQRRCGWSPAPPRSSSWSLARVFTLSVLVSQPASGSCWKPNPWAHTRRYF